MKRVIGAFAFSILVVGCGGPAAEKGGGGGAGAGRRARTAADENAPQPPSDEQMKKAAAQQQQQQQQQAQAQAPEAKLSKRDRVEFDALVTKWEAAKKANQSDCSMAS